MIIFLAGNREAAAFHIRVLRLPPEECIILTNRHDAEKLMGHHFTPETDEIIECITTQTWTMRDAHDIMAALDARKTGHLPYRRIC